MTRLHSFMVVSLALTVVLGAEFSNTNRNPRTFAPAVAEAWPVVVELRTRDPAPEGGLEESGTGSGVIVDRRGYILTCLHVVSGSAEIAVELEGESSAGTVVATDEFLDLALVKVEHTFPKAVTWGNSAKLRPGDFVVVVGYPFDIAKLASLGIISAIDFNMRYPVLVSDAAINPGNSGGGMFDSRGALVGIPHRLHGAEGLRAYTGIGFAIPGNTARLFVIRNLPTK